jgi:hypothetical protein
MEQTHNPTDTITVDVPLFIRLLEFAREDAKADLDLHVVAENAIALSKGGTSLTMNNYNDIIKDANKEDQTMAEVKRMIELANIKSFFK